MLNIFRSIYRKQHYTKNTLKLFVNLLLKCTCFTKFLQICFTLKYAKKCVLNMSKTFTNKLERPKSIHKHARRYACNNCKYS